MIQARKEAALHLYEVEGRKETPVIAVIRDNSSGHFVLYHLVEMNGDDIEQSYNSEKKISYEEKETKIPGGPSVA